MRSFFALSAAACFALLTGCEASRERVVYVPRSSTGIGAGDSLGLTLAHRASTTRVAASSARSTNVATAPKAPATIAPRIATQPRPAAPAAAAARASSPVATAAARQTPVIPTPVASAPKPKAKPSNVRMPLITFAPTDGPSAD